MHNYVIDCESHSHLKGNVLSSLKFTNPTSLVNAIKILRKQLLFNTVVNSFLRPQREEWGKGGGEEDVLFFHITCPSLECIECIFENPTKEEEIIMGEF